MERNGKDLRTEVDMMNELPRDASDRAIKLMGMMFDSAMSFVKSHSLKLSMPEEGSISRALDQGKTFYYPSIIEERHAHPLRNPSHP